MILAAVSMALAQTASPATAPTPKPCATAAYRAFDFWVGDWVVAPTGQAKPIADSKIENLYGGCAIRENWMPFGKAGGGSLSSYDPTDGRWHQVWIDSTGTRVDFDGGSTGGTMILVGLWRDLIAPGKHALVRMTYKPNSDGTVRQFGEQSEDHGKSWSTSFDFTYRRKAAPR